MEGSPDCWANHWYNLPQSPRTVFMEEKKEWEKGLTKSLWTSHIQHAPSLNCYSLGDATELWAPEQPDTETVSSLNPSHEHLTLNVEHTTLLYIIHSSHILIFHFKLAHIRPVHTQLSVLYIVFLLFCTLPICILFFIICVLSCCFLSVTLWSFCHYNKFLVCVNIPGK